MGRFRHADVVIKTPELEGIQVIRYKLYPSLMDSFAWMLRSEDENAVTEFVNRVNRVGFEPSDALLRGSQIDQMMIDLAEGKGVAASDGMVRIHDQDVSLEVIRQLHVRLLGSVRQVAVQSVIPTRFGDVLAYGRADNVLRDECIDLKSTGRYEFPKYLHSFQRPVYLEGLRQQGIDRFTFLVTDFRDVYEEPYHRTEEDRDRLIDHCERLIEFLEANRHRITDRKIFALD